MGCVRLWLLAGIVSSPLVALVAADDVTPAVDFAAVVAPVLQRHCIRCHQPGNEKGDLSLATPDGLREAGQITPGDPAASHLIEVVTAIDGARPAMPKEGDPLTPEEVEQLRQWIAGGAEWPEGYVVRQASKADRSWWSLQPIADVAPPVVADAPLEWQAGEIDRFIWAQLAEQHLQPNPPADRRTLIRRVTYDLTGLPPTPEEVAEFDTDESEEAYAKLIDRLLDSPRYGERWGRHWLDVVRFGESRGYERNEIITNFWPFRDYVIRSFNADKPFDQLIREHLAGDVIGTDQPESRSARRFWWRGRTTTWAIRTRSQAAQIRANTMDELIQATCDAFLGLTVVAPGVTTISSTRS